MSPFGREAYDSPLQPDDKVHLGLSLNVEVARLPRLPLEPDVLLLGLEVLLCVLVRALEDDLALGLGILALSAMSAVQSGRGVEGRRGVQPRKMVNLQQHRRSSRVTCRKFLHHGCGRDGEGMDGEK